MKIRDISSITKEVYFSPLDEKVHILSTTDHWTVVSGVRYFKKSLKVDNFE